MTLINLAVTAAYLRYLSFASRNESDSIKK
jgi:hypothetical protein